MSDYNNSEVHKAAVEFQKQHERYERHEIEAHTFRPNAAGVILFVILLLFALASILPFVLISPR